MAGVLACSLYCSDLECRELAGCSSTVAHLLSQLHQVRIQAASRHGCGRPGDVAGPQGPEQAFVAHPALAGRAARRFLRT